MIKIGVIADDFTGATDIASFLVLNGLSTIQLTEVSDDIKAPDVEAIVISGKTRSCPVDEAIKESLKALRWLQKNDCKQIYIKYCSTFDSTSKGNIGPIVDAVMKELGEKFTVVSPSLPVNKRTVYKGYLYAGDVLLQDSGMRNHPITPMTDSYLPRLMEAQSEGKCAVIDIDVLDQGTQAVIEKVKNLTNEGFSYAAVDALNEKHLITQGEAFKDLKVVTGGSGLAIGLARAVCEKNTDVNQKMKLGYPQGEKAVVLSGSCSVMTNKQVCKYKNIAEAKLIEIDKLRGDESVRESYVDECVSFVCEHESNKFAPMLYATADPDTLHAIQNKYGNAASASAVEHFFADVALKLKNKGYERFIVAGGETSGIVTKTLGVKGFYIGPAVAPGVPWVRSINSPISLTLKSGNFGDENFFEKTQSEYPV